MYRGAEMRSELVDLSVYLTSKAAEYSPLSPIDRSIREKAAELLKIWAVRHYAGSTDCRVRCTEGNRAPF
jgi:hypothetical protein